MCRRYCLGYIVLMSVILFVASGCRFVESPSTAVVQNTIVPTVSPTDKPTHTPTVTIIATLTTEATKTATATITPLPPLTTTNTPSPLSTSTVRPTATSTATPAPTITPTPTEVVPPSPTSTPDPIELIALPDDCDQNLVEYDLEHYEFLPCSDFQFSSDGRFVGFFYGPRLCIRAIIIMEVETSDVIYQTRMGSGMWFEFLENGKVFVTTGHCSGGTVNLLDPENGETRKLGGAYGFGPHEHRWNRAETSVGATIMSFNTIHSELWGYNVEEDFLFLSEPMVGKVNDDINWAPDDVHLLYHHRLLDYEDSAEEYHFLGSREIIQVSSETGEQQVLLSDPNYDYHILGDWYGDWIRVNKFPFEPERHIDSSEFSYSDEYACLTSGARCGSEAELLAFNWKTGELMAWSAWEEMVPELFPNE